MMTRKRPKWISPEEHQKALDKIETQQGEIDKLESADGKSINASKVKQHLRCPLCWNNLGGRAERIKWKRQINGPKQHRCYSCNQCGTEWVVEVTCEIVDDIEYKKTRIAKIREPIEDKTPQK